MIGLVGGGGGLNNPSVWSGWGRSNRTRYVDPMGIIPGSSQYQQKQKQNSNVLPHSGIPGARGASGNSGYSGSSGYSGNGYGSQGNYGYQRKRSLPQNFQDNPYSNWTMTDIKRYGGNGMSPYQKRAFGYNRNYGGGLSDYAASGYLGTNKSKLKNMNLW